MTSRKLPDNARRLLEKPVIGHFVTLMPDGSPQVTPVWVDTDGEYVLVNTAEGRVKPRNVRINPRVALSVVDPDDEYMGILQIRGKVVEVTPEGASEHIDKLAYKYLGKEKYPFHKPGDIRLILKMKAEHVSGGMAS